MTLSGKAKIAGVMGWPISHSRSPMLHGYWLQEYGIDGAYLPFPVAPENIETALRALPTLGIAGTNLTVPHKEAALTICDRVDDVARRIGAVNTVVVESDGTLSGSNTDAFGFLENLKSESDWKPDDGPAVILGAGGAARAVVAALIDDGVQDIRIVNRTLERAENLATEFTGACTAVGWNHADDTLEDAALLVNTTTLGMTGQPDLEISLKALPISATVNDIVYVPLQTSLLQNAAQRGNSIIDGLGMLLHQARPGFAAWFGKQPHVTTGLRDFILADLKP
ncbi:MAG: shikimate dehydrogenase [Rhodospirillaceae bacterium]|nr:shikimate dehydrogenase [Rhodospirillaceae bacterium]